MSALFHNDFDEEHGKILAKIKAKGDMKNA